MTVPILMYHSIAENAPPAFFPFSVHPMNFREQLRYLRDHDYKAMTVSELVRLRQEGAKAPDRSVVITFDDGFADFYEFALPALIEFSVPATLYVVSGSVSGRSAWLNGPCGEMPLLDWRRLMEVSKAGIEIGGHSVTHTALDLISPHRAKEEISHCKYTLEERLQINIQSFAYPFGFYSKTCRQLVVEAGFSSACAVRYGNSPQDDDPFALRRQIVRADTRLIDFAATLQDRSLRRHFDRVRSSSWRRVRGLWRHAS